ncbi:recombination protein NinB [Gilliamella sp. B14384G15]|uniref:recombination protein NinB n=1 Tax=unclassified Gilliamella TaxID=2685620 RepID=UPI0018DCDAA7|nr:MULTISPECIES: recombination protein NinB [unclassified Gilliamella]MBI0030643.1 recombination protein NinB [Gilliamella sp. B14384G15]MBI0057939.1 recombination protein NinB [Gilliamella sp. B14384G12]
MIREIRLTHESAREFAINIIGQLPIDNKHPLRIVIDEDKRSLAQNRMMWAVLNDIAKQVKWNGEQLTAEEWKHLITANLHGQKCLKGIDGGLVFMGLSTRKMNKKEFADVVTCAEQFGAENGVKFSNDALEAIRLAEQYKDQLSRVA